MPPPQLLDPSRGSGNTRLAWINMDPIFGPRPSFGVLPNGGIALHHQTDYAIQVIDSTGHLAATTGD